MRSIFGEWRVGNEVMRGKDDRLAERFIDLVDPGPA